MMNIYYRVTKDFGILKKGMLCCSIGQDKDNVILYFREPVMAGVQEIKLSKEVISDILEIS
tara:strand:+ start:1435 stop:1617 length:183 start_codon:yes stop_codon:yes gene_type:complete